MLFMNLDCGRQVFLENLAYSHTYGEILEGRPNSQLNAQIVDKVLTARETTRGNWKVHLIPPSVDDSDPAHPKLPPVLLRARLICNQPINPKFMASALLVLWFRQDCHNETIANVVFQAIHGLPWDQLARDFDW